jgi:kynurenine formamidase
MIVLLKTGWAEKRALTREFLTAWPYLTGEGAEYLVSRGVHGVGIEGLSIGGWDDPQKETAAHKVLLGAKKLIIEDIRVPEAMLDGSTRHFAAFPVLIQGAGGAWTRAVAWDEREMA